MKHKAEILFLALVWLLLLPLANNAQVVGWKSFQTAPESYTHLKRAGLHGAFLILQSLGNPVMDGNADAGMDQDFDDSWLSLRTFSLMKPLKRPLKIYVENKPEGNAIYKEKYVQYIQDSMAQWSAALEGRLRYELISNPQEANIVFHWVSSFPERDQAGLTDVQIGNASVQIKTVGIPDNIIRGNIMHELGHALGIEGHSKFNRDIMMSGRSWSSYQAYKSYDAKLSQRDIMAIRLLYSPKWKKGEDLYAALSEDSESTASLLNLQPFASAGKQRLSKRTHFTF